MVKQYAETSGLRFCKIRAATKKPFESDWVNKPYTWEGIQEHIRKEQNYGVLCGYGDLIVVDCDDNELHEQVRKSLPSTFEVLTGSGGKHCYYFCPEIKKKIVLQNEIKHYGEVQALGAQVVAAGSIHPNGSSYRVNVDAPIATVGLEQLMSCIKPFMKTVVESEKMASKENQEFIGDDDINSISITSVLNMSGYKPGRNGEYYGANPWHGSSTGMNFWVNPSKNIAHCFRCDCGVSVAKAIALNERIISNCDDELRGDKFIKTIEVAVEKYGLKRSNEFKKKDYDFEKINFTQDPMFNTWKKVKERANQVMRADGRLLFLSHDHETIKGKVMPITQTLQRIVMVRKVEIKDKESGDVKYIFKFLDDRADARFGNQVDALAIDFWIYRLIQNGKEFILFSQEPLECNEYEFRGMIIQMDNLSEVSKTLRFKSLSPVFLVHTAKSSVQTLGKNDLINFIKNSGITADVFREMVFMHPDGNVYEHIEPYNMLRTCQLLSGKYEGYPLHTLTIGPTGTGKTMEQEALDFKFCEEKGIFEAGNSTVKGLIPSFKEKPANPGYLLQCNRIALVDELFKMIDAASFSSEQLLRQHLGQLNMILEHKKRTIGSGNDNAITAKATAKAVLSTNPLSNKKTLAEHLSLIDSTTLSRMLIWVQDAEHLAKIAKKEVKSVQNTQRVYTVENRRVGETIKNDIVYPSCDLYSFIDAARSDFLTIFDSCQSFLSDFDLEKARYIYRFTENLLSEPLRTLWRARGLHHTVLLLDGLIKYRCLFEDWTPDFKGTDLDYDRTHALAMRIVQTWSTPLSLKTDWRDILQKDDDFVIQHLKVEQ